MGYGFELFSGVCFEEYTLHSLMSEKRLLGNISLTFFELKFNFLGFNETKVENDGCIVYSKSLGHTKYCNFMNT